MAMRQSFLPCIPYSTATARTLSRLLKSESKKAPADGLPLPNCISGEVQSLQPAGGIAEVFHVYAHAVHHGDEQIAHGSFLASHDAAARLYVVVAALARDDGGQVFMQVRVAIL